MHDEQAPVDPAPDPVPVELKWLTPPGDPDRPVLSEDECAIVELRMELDLAQLDHPSRWAKISR